MIIEYTSQNGTTISFERGYGRFNIIREGTDTRMGNVTGFSSDAHFYKFLNDNYPDIADNVYVGVFDFEPEEVDAELERIKAEAAGITDLSVAGPND